MRGIIDDLFNRQVEIGCLQSHIERKAMKISDIQKDIEGIRDKDGDPEAVHILEDKLYLSVLRSIASGDYGHASDMAKASLVTQDIIDERWYA